jgi:hypothetical protein
MKDSITEAKNTKLTIIVIISLAILVASIAIGIYSYNLDQKAIEVNANVVKVEYNNKDYMATVEYKVNEQAYTKIIKSNKEVAVNSKLPISYNKDNPNDLVNNTYWPIIAIALLFIAIILLIIFLPKFIKRLERNRLNKRLVLENTYIDIPISEIVVNNTIKPVNGTYAYKARMRYLNKKDNKEYVYESDDVFVDINKVIQETGINHIKIYIDKTNTDNYYVDLGSLYPDIPIINPDIVLGGDKKEEEKKEEPVEVKEEDKNQ